MKPYSRRQAKGTFCRHQQNDKAQIPEKTPALTVERFWQEVWIATTRSSNCSKITSPTEFADKAVEEFNNRFQIKPINTKE